MKVKVNFRIEEEVDQQLEAMAKGTKRTKSGILELLVGAAWDKFSTSGNLSKFEQAISLNNGVDKKRKVGDE